MSTNSYTTSLSYTYLLSCLLAVIFRLKSKINSRKLWRRYRLSYVGYFKITTCQCPFFTKIAHLDPCLSRVVLIASSLYCNSLFTQGYETISGSRSPTERQIKLNHVRRRTTKKAQRQEKKKR